MPLQLLPLEESEVPAYVGIIGDAFAGGLNDLFYPHGYSDDARAMTTENTLKSWRKHPEKIRKLKVIDTDLPTDGKYGQIIAVSDWEFYPKDRSDEELLEEEAEGKDRKLPPGSNEECMTAFFKALKETKKQHLGGKAHIRCHILTTLPHHHRRGAGAMALNWGFEQADKLGIPVWLEASPMGRPLYERVGFETVGWLPFDAKKFGAKEDMPHAVMLRQPKKAGVANGQV